MMELMHAYFCSSTPNKELHMFVWSSSASPVSEGNLKNAVNRSVTTDFGVVDSSKAVLQQQIAASRAANSTHDSIENASPIEKMNGGDREVEIEDGTASKFGTKSSPYTKKVDQMEEGLNENHQMPPASVMTRLILIMVWRKLIRNPNTYSSLICLILSVITFRDDKLCILGCLVIGRSYSIAYDNVPEEHLLVVLDPLVGIVLARGNILKLLVGDTKHHFNSGVFKEIKSIMVGTIKSDSIVPDRFKNIDSLLH